MQPTRNLPIRAAAAVALCAALAVSLHARETVIEDAPARLVFEMTVPGYAAVEGAGGDRVIAEGFANVTEEGAPDLPRYVFRVATGGRMPRVAIEPLEWVEVDLPRGLAGSPRWISNKEFEPHKDPDLFAAARGLTPRVSGIQRVRGMELRRIEFPLGTYTEGSGRARMLARFRVRVDFPDPASAPSPGVRPWLEREGVLNPRGGAHLTALPRRTGLRRAATSLPSDPDGLLKIRVGNREVDDLSSDGMHALTYQTASDAGLPSGVQLQHLRLYTGPKDTSTVRMDGAPVAPTLREAPLEVRDANNSGTFDAGDTILFYAHGTSIWKPVAGAPGPVLWEFKNDPWSFENYYYLDWSPGAGGARLDTAAFVPPAATVTAAPEYLRAQRDLGTGSCDPALLFDDETGFVWYWYWKDNCGGQDGPGFGSFTPTLTASHLARPATATVPGRATDTLLVGMFTYLNSNIDYFDVWAGGEPMTYVTHGVAGAWYRKTSDFPSGDALEIDSVQWGNDGKYRFIGYTVRYTRDLEWNGQNRIVFPAVTGQRVGYSIADAPPGLRVLRVEAGIGGRWLALQPSGGNLVFSDSVGAGDDVLYYLYGDSPRDVTASMLTPESAPAAGGAVVRNLVTGDGSNPGYLIVAPALLVPEAVELAEYRADPARLMPLASAVVRVEDVYREWSGGRLSPVAIRDFLRWALHRWGNGGGMGNLRYVLLLGDGHYDYRDIHNGNSVNPSPNLVPPFNWQHTLGNPMSTDDFYAVLDSGKLWSQSNNSGLDIALGRIPARTREQARDYLEKMRVYEDPASGGEWRSRVLLTADDATQRRAPGGVDGVTRHTRQAEDLGNVILGQDSGTRVEKTYLFDYDHNAAFLKPEATQALLNQLNRGALLFNFYGHGAYNQMADEVFLKTNDGLARLRNGPRNFCMTIFSCTVGRFDKLKDEGMTEEFIRQREHGAIIGIAGTRETYPSENQALGNAFALEAFARDSFALRGVGEQLRVAKNMTQGNDNQQLNNKKYALLGDPALALKRPGVGLQLETTPDTLRALDCGTIAGRVTQGSGRGQVNVRIVAGNVPKSYSYRSSRTNPEAFDTTTVAKRGPILFERTIPYEDSVFSMEYFLPKQVPFGDTAAKIQAFAWDAEQLRESAVLVRNLPIADAVGESCVEDDQRGPRVAVTGCNVRESGEVDFPDAVKISLPYCLQISVSDTGSGVLGGEGPDQGTTVEIVGSIEPFQPQPILDELYTKTYQTSLSPQEIAPGSHLLRVTSRDGFGNLTRRQVTLEVSEAGELRFVHAFNVPNPMRDAGTTFHFSTTLPVEVGGDLTSPDVDRVRFDLRIFNQRGHMVREFRDAVSGETAWDGRDAWGRQLANGVYFYQVTATWSETEGGPQGGRRVSRKNTLVISR